MKSIRRYLIEESNLIAIYRKEVDSNDHFHKSIAFILGLIIVGLGIAYDVTGITALIIATPALSIALLGTIIRLDTIVHRLGWLLEKLSCPWEMNRNSLVNDKQNLVIADILSLVPVLFYLIKAYATLWPIYGTDQTIGGRTLLWISIFLNVFGVVLWINTPRRAREENGEPVHHDGE